MDSWQEMKESIRQSSAPTVRFPITIGDYFSIYAHVFRHDIDHSMSSPIHRLTRGEQVLDDHLRNEHLR